jgi:N-acetylglucosaminyldiphosphoundecaprenol N-acetyl-beta-D-mannosaminyltransferase
MTQIANLEHFDLLIRPEQGSGIFPVSLWAARGLKSGQRLYAAPQDSWLEYSRRLEQTNLMDERDLGRADACISRGESMLHSVLCSPQDLALLGFGEEQVKIPKHLRTSWLLAGREETASAEGAAMTAVLSDEALPESAAAKAADGKAQIAQKFRNQIALLGVRIDNFSMDEVVETIDRFIDEGGFHQVATANVDFVTKAFDDSELLDILRDCELVVADGMPLVWASRVLGVALRERVTGADLVPRLLELSAQKKRRIFLLGATEENSRAAAERIKQEYPEAVICGRYSPPFTPGQSVDDEHVFELLEQAKPDILLVAFGNPKQEKWISRNRDRLKVPVCIGVGASIDFLSGRQSRAPFWMQKTGLEWMHRLVNEPRRLAVRYFDNGLFLLRYLSVQLLTTSLQPRTMQERQIKLAWHGEVLTVGVVGGFCGAAAQEMFQELERQEYDGSLVLDLSGTDFITPDATGLLLYLSQKCTRAGRELWIAGGTAQLHSVLQATFPAGEPFRVAMTMPDALHFVATSKPSHYSALGLRVPRRVNFSQA